MNFSSAAATSKPEIWSIGKGSPVIEYSANLFRRIAKDVARPYLAVSRGGFEVGGVLFGTRHADRILIHDYRVFDCEYLNGPVFSFSPADEVRFEELLKLPKTVPELAGLEAVGWFHSHTRSGIYLSGADLELHRRFFTKPWQVALVLRPYRSEPTRAGFFFREADGRFRSEASYREFLIDPLPAVFPEPSTVSGPTQSDSARLHFPIPRIVATRKPLLAALAAGVAALVVGAVALTRPEPQAPLPPRLTLQTRGNQIAVEWDRASEAIRNARSARMEILEAGRAPYSVPLTPADLNAGSLVYLRDAGDVSFRLLVNGKQGGNVEMRAHLIAPAGPHAAPALEIQDLAEATVNAGAPFQDQTRTRRRETALARTFRPPAGPARWSHPSLSLEPALPSVSLAPSTAAVPNLDQLWRPQLPTPRAGRLIWTGTLRRNHELFIRFQESSEGSLAGSWPVGDYQIRAYPARADSEGIVAYLANTNVRRPVGAEPPVQYVWNPDRAQDLEIDQDTDGGNWRTLRVRSKARRISALVLDWERR